MLSQIPRTEGNKSYRSGQDVFGNMCHGVHMFAPTKTWCHWHCRVNTTHKRYALCSALAALVLLVLVLSKGPHIEEVSEFPLGG